MRPLIVAALLWAWTPPPQEIGWLKLDQAKAIASHTNKLILVYVACDPRSGSAPCNGGAAERAFSEPSILKRQEEFHFVRIGEKKTAQLVRATKGPEAIILDPDGDELHRSGFGDARALDVALGAALQRYVPKEVRWGNDVTIGAPGKSLLVVGFDDDKGEALKAFDDRLLAKYHDRIEFVKYPARKESDAARKWGVTQGPAVIVCDAAQESPEKHPLEKLTGKRSPAALKSALQRAFQKVDAKK